MHAATVALAGAVAPLVAMVHRETSAESKTAAAGMLGCLAYNSTTRRAAIVAAGGVPPLVALVGHVISIQTVLLCKVACSRLTCLCCGSNAAAQEGKVCSFKSIPYLMSSPHLVLACYLLVAPVS